MKLKSLMDEYSAIKTYTQCIYAAAIDSASEEQIVCLMQFLMGLNDSYFVIRSNILMTSPLPSVILAYNIVSQEKSHKSLSSASNETVVAFVAKKPFKSKAKNLNLKCSHCGGLCHLV